MRQVFASNKKKGALSDQLDSVCSKNAELDAIRRYWRHRASAFWATHPHYRICDGCGNPNVPSGTGYVWGSDLYCDECGAKALINAADKNLREWFSVELPKALNFVKRK